MRYALSRLMKVWVLGLPLLLAFTTGVVQAGNNSQVTLCHIPPGNPANHHTITVGENAVENHLNHGDLLGSCLSNCDILCDDVNECTKDTCDPDTEQCSAEHPPVTCPVGTICDPTNGGCIGVVHIPCTHLLSCAGGQSCDLTSKACVSVSCNDSSLLCGAGQVCDLTSGKCLVGSCNDSSVVCNGGLDCDAESEECRLMGPPMVGGCSSKPPPCPTDDPYLTAVCVGTQWQWRYNI